MRPHISLAVNKLDLYLKFELTIMLWHGKYETSVCLICYLKIKRVLETDQVD